MKFLSYQALSFRNPCKKLIMLILSIGLCIPLTGVATNFNVNKSFLDKIMNGYNDKVNPYKNHKRWDDRWCEQWRDDDDGCSKKELANGKVNLCVTKKNRTSTICVSQKQATYWTGLSKAFKNKVFSYPTTYFKDADKDKYGVTSLSVLACEAPAGYVAKGGDCNDKKAAINPGALDGCSVNNDGIDNNCDGIIDNGAVKVFTDLDKDGFGDTSTERMECASANTVTRGGDCDDSNAAINPDAEEVACDGVDNDCKDGDLIQGNLTYPDSDNDGYGDANATGVLACAGIDNNLDCNDGVAGINPGATEICDDGIDNNCDGKVDAQDTLTCAVQTGTCPQVHVDFTDQVSGFFNASTFRPEACVPGRLPFDGSLFGHTYLSFSNTNGVAGWELTDGIYQPTPMSQTDFNACMDYIGTKLNISASCAKY